MKKCLWKIITFFLCTLALNGNIAFAAPELPVLNWQQRSDWVNVKTAFGAVGNGVADDTAAIQNALNQANNGYQTKPIYLPAGTYKITSTLHLSNNTGGMIIGNGSSTRIVWAGAQNGVMYWSDGCTYFRYVGLIWDGNNIAGVGIDHATNSLYETQIRHQNQKFCNLRIAGIRVGNSGTSYSAEIYIDNCLFYRCNKGFVTLQANSYDNSFDGCEFQDNTYGVYCGGSGNAYVRNSHFERSTEADLFFEPHSDVVRRCTSIGSKRFILVGGSLNGSPLAVQDCRVKGWTSTTGAINMSSRGPSVIFDTSFSNPPSTAPPIKLDNWSMDTQSLVVSKNTSTGTTAIVSPSATSTTYEITGGVRGPSGITAETSFFHKTAFVPTSIIDVKTDYGAAGNGTTDDTVAIQNAINAAKVRGNNCLVYLPAGEYRVTNTLDMQTGSNYSMGGTGWSSRLKFQGTGQCIQLRDPNNLRLEQMRFVAPDSVNKVRQNSTANTASKVSYDGLYLTNSNNSATATYGLEIHDLPAQGKVLLDQDMGDIWFRSCSAGTILANFWSDGVTRVSNDTVAPRTGFLGVNTRINSNNNYDLIIYDNESIVIGAYYTETTHRSLTIPHSTLTNVSGHVTLNYSRCGTTDTPAFSIDNYRGRVAVFGALFNTQNPLTITYYSGTNPTTLIFCGDCYQVRPPIPNFGSNVNLMLVRNIVDDQANGMYENSFTSNSSGLVELANALDDFRQLGQVDLAMNYGM